MNISKAKLARKEELLAALVVPKTITGLCKELGKDEATFYNQIYRELVALINEGVVKEMPWKEGRKIVYGRAVKVKEGQLLLGTPVGAIPLAQIDWLLRPYISDQFPPSGFVIRALQYLYRRDYNSGEGPSGLHGSRTKQQVKQTLRDLQRESRELQQLIAQLLTEYRLWDEKDTDLDKYGDVDSPAYWVEKAAEFDEVMYPAHVHHRKQIEGRTAPS